MKILLVNNLYPPHDRGGAGRSVHQLARGLHERGHRVRVFTLKANGSPDQRTEEGVEVRSIPVPNFYWPFEDRNRGRFMAALWYLRDLRNPSAGSSFTDVLTEFDPDLVHTNNLLGFSISAWNSSRESHVPLVHTTRDYYLICLRSSMFRGETGCGSPCFDCSVARKLRFLGTGDPDVLVAPSRRTLEIHKQYLPLGDRVHYRVIPNGHAGSSGSEDVLQAGNENRDSLVLGYLGRIHPTKGLHRLLAHLEDLRDRNWVLRVGGAIDSDFASRLRDQYSGDRVHFHGYVDPEPFLNQIDVLVVPSLWEDPLPRTVFEAYFRCVPVIGTNRGGIPEMIESGQTGFLIDHEDFSPLEDHLERLEKDPALLEKLSRGACDRAGEYTRERMVNQYEELYESLVVS